MKTYNVKNHIVHDGEDFQPDDEIALSDEAAQPLLAVDAIEDPAEAKKAEKPARAPKKVAKK